MVAHISGGSPGCRLVWEMTLHGLTLCDWFQSYGRLMAAMVYAWRFRRCTSPPTSVLRRKVCEKEYGQFTFESVSRGAVPQVLRLEPKAVSTYPDREAWGDAHGLWPVRGEVNQDVFKVLLFFERGDIEPFGLREALLTGKMCWVEIELNFPEQFFAVKFETLYGLLQAWVADDRDAEVAEIRRRRSR